MGLYVRYGVGPVRYSKNLSAPRSLESTYRPPTAAEVQAKNLAMEYRAGLRRAARKVRAIERREMREDIRSLGRGVYWRKQLVQMFWYTGLVTVAIGLASHSLTTGLWCAAVMGVLMRVHTFMSVWRWHRWNEDESDPDQHKHDLPLDRYAVSAAEFRERIKRSVAAE